MKEKFKSWGSERAALATLAAAVLLCVEVASTTQVFAQRAGRPPSRRELEGTPILPAGTRVVPDGTVLIVEMDTRLNSGTSQVSDRFIARIATPVVDASGRTLLPTGAIIEGHVAAVKKARWGHRSGELGLAFDYVDLGYGRKLPLRATIVSGTNPVNEEGDLKAKSSGKRDVLVTTGGAVAGAGVGMLTGASILAGGGAGAAAGLTVVLVMKGKNVDIDVGERFNLELVQPISVNDRYGIGTGGRQIRRPVSLLPTRTRTSTPRLGDDFGPYDDSVRTAWSRVPVYDASAQRDRDGMLRVTVTAETSTQGWRIYTHHEKASQDTLDIRLMGIPPSQYGVRRTDHPSAPAICVDDRNNVIRRIVIRGSNGARYLSIGQGATSARIDSNSRSASPNAQPYYPPPISQSTRPRVRPGAGSGGSAGGFGGPPYDDYPPSQSSNSNLSLLAAKTANQIEIVKALYSPQIGLWMDEQGTQLPGTRRATATERQLYDMLITLHTSAKSLAAPLSSSSRLRAGQQLQRDTQNAQQLWQRVRSSSSAITPELDRRWQEAYNNLRSLSAAASR
jgi:opacity protein-like surface antigen